MQSSEAALVQMLKDSFTISADSHNSSSSLADLESDMQQTQRGGSAPTPPDDFVLNDIRRQVEYLLSPTNVQRDILLQQYLCTYNGCFPIYFLTQYPNIQQAHKQLGHYSSESLESVILRALENSRLVSVSDDGRFVYLTRIPSPTNHHRTLVSPDSSEMGSIVGRPQDHDPTGKDTATQATVTTSASATPTSFGTLEFDSYSGMMQGHFPPIFCAYPNGGYIGPNMIAPQPVARPAPKQPPTVIYQNQHAPYVPASPGPRVPLTPSPTPQAVRAAVPGPHPSSFPPPRANSPVKAPVPNQGYVQHQHVPFDTSHVYTPSWAPGKYPILPAQYPLFAPPHNTEGGMYTATNNYSMMHPHAFHQMTATGSAAMAYPDASAQNQQQFHYSTLQPHASAYDGSMHEQGYYMPDYQLSSPNSSVLCPPDAPIVDHNNSAVSGTPQKQNPKNRGGKNRNGKNNRGKRGNSNNKRGTNAAMSHQSFPPLVQSGGENQLATAKDAENQTTNIPPETEAPQPYLTAALHPVSDKQVDSRSNNPQAKDDHGNANKKDAVSQPASGDSSALEASMKKLSVNE